MDGFQFSWIQLEQVDPLIEIFLHIIPDVSGNECVFGLRIIGFQRVHNIRNDYAAGHKKCEPHFAHNWH